MERKTWFRIALAIRSEEVEAGRYYARDFARQHGVSMTMLYGVLNGTHHSERLERAIDRFIEEEKEKLFDDEPALATA